MEAVIFLHPPPSGVTPPQMSDDTPPAQCDFFDFLMFFNVNLHFAHVYNPPNICLYPSQFKIPRNNPGWKTG